MDYDLLKILSDSNKDIDNQKIMDYIAGKLSAEEKHEVEKWMSDSHFMNDAVEGLAAVKNKAKIADTVEQLNQDLQKRLEKKRNKKKKRQLKENPWIYYTLILVLFLLILSWYLVHKLKGG